MPTFRFDLPHRRPRGLHELEQVRSYVLAPYKLVKDLRCDVEAHPDDVLNGDIDCFLRENLARRRKWELEWAAMSDDERRAWLTMPIAYPT